MRGLILTLCLLSTPASVMAQGDSASGRWPDLGSRVRVWTTSRRITGDLVNIRSDTLVIRVAEELSPLVVGAPVGQVELVPGSSVIRVDVRRGPEYPLKRIVGGAAGGAAAGVVAAAVVDLLVKGSTLDWGAKTSVSYGNAAAVGAAAGAVLGLVMSGDRWEAMQRSSLAPAFTTALGGIGVAVVWIR